MLDPAVGAPKPQSSPAERRVAVRYRCRPDVSCRVQKLHPNDAQWARIYNVSTTGIGLLMTCRIEPDTRVTIQIPTPLKEFAGGLPVRVAHSTIQEDGNWLVGCVFERRLNEDELRELFL